MTTEKEIIVEVIDESSDEDRNSSPRKVYKRASSDAEVYAKAAAIYFQKLSELIGASNSKKQYGAIEDLLSNASRAHKAGLKYITENSETHKENERQAKKFLPESAIDDFHAWLDDSEDSDD